MKIKNLETIGRNIRARRAYAGLTQDHLGTLVDTTGATISCYECGKTRRPDFELLAKIADIFSCTIDDLLEDEGHAKVPERPESRTEDPEPELRSVHLSYIYEVDIDEHTYRVICTRDVTETDQHTPFTYSYIRTDGTDVPDHIRRALQNVVRERIDQYKRYKTALRQQASRVEEDHESAFAN